MGKKMIKIEKDKRLEYFTRRKVCTDNKGKKRNKWRIGWR